MQLLASIVFFLLFFNSCEPLKSTCNYVYNQVEKKAWATNVCIPWNADSSSNYHIQYVCLNGSMHVQYHSNEECTNMVSSFNLVEYIENSNSSDDHTSLSFTYSCSGRDGCYVQYLENCETSNSILNYPPIQSCIVDNSTSSSWMLDCDDDALFYAIFKDKTCNELDSLQLVTNCTNINNHTTWQYWGCQLPPTPIPTSIPTSIPTAMPFNSPSIGPTAYPTWFIPFYGVNLSELANGIHNDDESKSFIIFFSHHYLLWIIGLVIMMLI